MRNKILLTLIFVLFTCVDTSAIQNPNEKNLEEPKKSAVSLDEKGHIVIETEKLQNATTVSLIEHKISNSQANLLENDKIKITPAFPSDCNTFMLMWLLEKQNNKLVLLPKSEEASKETKLNSEQK